MSSKSSRRSGFTLRQPPVVDIGCNCRRPKLFSLFSSSSLPFRGGAGGKPKSPTNASSSSTTTAFTATTVGGLSGTTATTSTDSASWGPASFTNNSLYEDPPSAHRRQPAPEQPETRRRRRQQQRRRRRRAEQQEQEEAAAAAYGRVARESVPVAVESAEPYEDFRESMVQMVVEKEIYAWDDLNDLLHQFLTLNSPRHHPLILHAFADLWTRNGLFSPPSPCQF
ncbi:transcription repressor OFP8 [Brachypodium distachyon]|uniref:Transcription repressor n=1 Tax=Brachypodium distachyon TaxID=15368 RepID=I1HTP2_BRADI|nr:transcription repressor OFP8 [Brachypodium distachyon]PNT73242.1 hypothetical protein BRADI_2g55880v3 [Brachypodium distachyon]|eukprot:XP_003567302.1 transcription repressor OFP8 [Brachypodium distachyon]